jgi:hypothetical protein
MTSLPQLDESGGGPTSRRPFWRNTTMRYILGAVIGGLLGFGYYKLVGCSTGTCPLSSNPWISTVYGMIMGAMLAGSR